MAKDEHPVHIHVRAPKEVIAGGSNLGENLRILQELLAIVVRVTIGTAMVEIRRAGEISAVADGGPAPGGTSTSMSMACP